MSMIQDYIEKSGSTFLSPENTKIGDLVKIFGVSLDSTTFDKSYIIVDGVLERTGEECKIRLGVQNLKRIAEELTENETNWPGNYLKIIVFQEYSGLGKKGIIWSGKKAVTEKPSLADPFNKLDLKTQ